MDEPVPEYTKNMKNLSEFNTKINFVLTDIDDTLTDHGQLKSEAYEALWKLKEKGIKIIPITGRPAGWCEMIARFWPVEAIVGENGGFYFRYHNKKMHRTFFFSENEMKKNREKLNLIEHEVLSKVPGCAIASDQFCRLMDLAVDFCEDVPALPKSSVDQIVKIFNTHGAQAKVSSIHVNGWFGSYDKLHMSLRLLKEEFGLDEEAIQKQCAFCGDSPNDEPMFQYFPSSFGVANIKNFLTDLKNPPKYLAPSEGGRGFSEIARQLLQFAGNS